MNKTRISEGLRKAYQALSAQFSGDGRLTIPQVTALRGLMQGGILTQTDLVETTGIDRSTLSELLRRLSKQGLVVMVTHPNDKRATAVTITGRGRKAVMLSDGALSDIEATILKVVSPEDRAPFLRAIRAIAESPQL